MGETWIGNCIVWLRTQLELTFFLSFAFFNVVGHLLCLTTSGPDVYIIVRKGMMFLLQMLVDSRVLTWGVGLLVLCYSFMERLFCLPNVQTCAVWAALNSIDYITLFIPGFFVLVHPKDKTLRQRGLKDSIYVKLERPSEFPPQTAYQPFTPSPSNLQECQSGQRPTSGPDDSGTQSSHVSLTTL